MFDDIDGNKNGKIDGCEFENALKHVIQEWINMLIYVRKIVVGF